MEAIWCHFASRLDGFKRFAYFRKFNLLRGICLSHSLCACTSSSPSCSLEFSDKSFSAGVPPKFCFCSMFSHTTINFFLGGRRGRFDGGEVNNSWQLQSYIMSSIIKDERFYVFYTL